MKVFAGQNLAMSDLLLVTKMYDYVFSENGLVAYKSGELLAIQVNYMMM